jgi:hypothetical protein
MKVKIGDRVKHINHGTGIVTASYGNQGSALVKFDKQPKGWDTEIEVSTALLTKIHTDTEVK